MSLYNQLLDQKSVSDVVSANGNGINLIDENKVLLKYVERNFNYCRKQLKLP